jgi:hypothetical protein
MINQFGKDNRFGKGNRFGTRDRLGSFPVLFIDLPRKEVIDRLTHIVNGARASQKRT